MARVKFSRLKPYSAILWKEELLHHSLWKWTSFGFFLNILIETPKKQIKYFKKTTYSLAQKTRDLPFIPQSSSTLFVFFHNTPCKKKPFFFFLGREKNPCLLLLLLVLNNVSLNKSNSKRRNSRKRKRKIYQS